MKIVGIVALNEQGKLVVFPMTNSGEVIPFEEFRPEVNPVLSALIESLGLPIRAEKVLKGDGIRTIADVLARSEWDLLRITGFGRRYLADLREALTKHGVSLQRWRVIPRR